MTIIEEVREERKLLITDRLFLELLGQAGLDRDIHIEWGEPTTEIVTYYSPIILHKLPDGRWG